MSNQALLSAHHLSMVYPNGNGGLAALRDIGFELQPQEFLCVVGPSGCGKSTLLRILGGLLPATSGQVLFSGKPVLRPLRRIGFVFQQANLMPWRTARENVALPLELDGRDAADCRARADALMGLVGLGGFEDAYPRDLSGGMAQRVAIARALIHEPELLLLDEPFGALDALTRERMGGELMRIWGARKVTVVMVTHSISEAVLLADRVLVLSSRPGHVIFDETIPLPRPRDLLMTHTQEFGILASRIRQAIASQG